MQAQERAAETHPLDGVWVPGSALLARAQSDGSGGPTDPARPEAERPEPARPGPRALLTAAARSSATGLALPARALRGGPPLEPTDAALRIDLDPEDLSKRARAATAEAAALGADLLGIPVPDPAAGDGAAFGARAIEAALLAAEQEDAEVVLLLEHPSAVPLALELAAPDGPVVGVRAAFHDEEATEQLAAREDLGLIAAADEFVGAFRRGAGAMEGALCVLAPRAAAAFLERCHDDVEVAVQEERRWLRFLEGYLRPAARRLGGASNAGPDGLHRLCAAVGGWGPQTAPADLVRELRAALADQLPPLHARLG